MGTGRYIRKHQGQYVARGSFPKDERHRQYHAEIHPSRYRRHRLCGQNPGIPIRNLSIPDGKQPAFGRRHPESNDSVCNGIDGDEKFDGRDRRGAYCRCLRRIARRVHSSSRRYGAFSGRYDESDACSGHDRCVHRCPCDFCRRSRRLSG